MNRYPLWKYVFIVVLALAGALYAVPNFFGNDPALQISADNARVDTAGIEPRIEAALKEAGVDARGIERTETGVLVRMTDTEAQLKAKDYVSAALGEDYNVAVNLAPATPGWLRAIGGKPMYLGLDLRGGVHILLEVDMDAAAVKAEERLVADVKRVLREKQIRYQPFNRSDGGGIRVRLRDADGRAEAADVIATELPELAVTTPAAPGEELDLTLAIKPEVLVELRKTAVQQNLTILRNRVNELGVAEPVIQQQGESRIVVQLPGIQDTARAIEILGGTATLEFRMVDLDHDVQNALAGTVPPRSKLYRETMDGNPVLLSQDLMLTGECIIDAASGIEQQNGSPAVFITLEGACGHKFNRETRDQVGKPMAVVFLEKKTVTTKARDGAITKVQKPVERVINIATIREELGHRFQISGLDSTDEARNLALLLRAGALAAPIEVVEQRTVGPTLGRENVAQGRTSVIIAMLACLAFMAFYYRVFGLAADVALTMNLVFILAIMSLLQATLTLPGIAGIVLTVGMAVDANVLINERILEELRNGNTPQASINAGYERAWATILDSNVTTLIAGVLLFAVGTGPIKGFAVTLCVGIITSMFTAVVVSRAVVNLIYGGRKVTQLSI